MMPHPGVRVGPPASTWRRTVLREMPSTRAVARIESPCSCAWRMALQRACCRGVGGRSGLTRTCGEGAVCDESVAAVWHGLRKVERAIGDLQAASAIGDGEGGRGRIGSRRARGGLAMTTTVKATYANGVLTPEEPLDLMEGARVTVSIEGAPPTGGGLGAIVEAVKELHKSIPEDAWDVLPTDLAKNKKHYLYGHPKEDD